MCLSPFPFPVIIVYHFIHKMSTLFGKNNDARGVFYISTLKRG